MEKMGFSHEKRESSIAVGMGEREREPEIREREREEEFGSEMRRVWASQKQICLLRIKLVIFEKF